ncbi:transposable element tc3 transposase [Lasius niger]|uniref:Transposable element tc3 transposase n=1 Tax=Lasius niger TaxID=67767 RepID=A0A0J7N1M4_LASNI|nr:transposable element tc3 transposase [Lasius niger]
MNSKEYIHILSNVMMPYIAETFPGIPYVNFVQDNSGVHRARIAQDWLARQPNFRTLNYPAKSPDLNVIENLWAEMVREWNPQIRRTREALA